MRYLFSSMVILCLAIQVSARDVWLYPMFGKNMVFQSGMKVPVWGKADAGATVKVTLGKYTAEATAKDSGAWIAYLPPMPVNRHEQTLVVTCKGKERKVSGVLVGEVWLCSGQSNMAYDLGRLSRSGGKLNKLGEATQNVNYPQIRQFRFMPQRNPFEEIKSMRSKGWAICKGNPPGFSGAAYFFALELHKRLDVPVGLIVNPWSGVPIQPFVRREALLAIPEGKKCIEHWEKRAKAYDFEAEEVKYRAAMDARNKDKATGEKLGRPPRRPRRIADLPFYPSCVYNGMVAPVIPYGIKGAIWYQGESNVRDGHIYASYFRAMVEDWRKQWGQGDFPFYTVQLAGRGHESRVQEDFKGWCHVREAQRECMKVKNTGMAVAIDIGEHDIHPRNKIDVGKRLAYWALAKDYGKKIVYSGPLFKEAKVDGKKITITFSSVGSGLQAAIKPDKWSAPQPSNEPLKWFYVRGSGKRWVKATAKITGKDTVELISGFTDPKAVRFAWAMRPVGFDLYNREGLPASPFEAKLQ